MQVALAFEWYGLLNLGDFYDQYSVSRYVKDPSKLASFHKEIKQAKRECLDPLNKVGFKRKKITLGNHDLRIIAYLKEKAPALIEKVFEEDWLGFKSTGWEVYNYHDYTNVRKLLATHEVGASGSLAVLNAVQDNVVTAHDHKINYIVKGTAKGILHVSATFGWLGDTKHAEYMHTLKARREWAPGFGYAHERRNGYMYVHPVPMVNYSCVVEGKLFTA